MAGEISADGASLMVREKDSAESILAAQMRSLRRGQQAILSATPAVDVVLDRTTSFDDLYVVCAGETDLQILPQEKPAEVMVDQVRTFPNIAEGFISLAHLAKGEHFVRITY
jgi:hypothetical protein